MTRILGYADRISAAPGECIQVMVSCEGLEQFDANLIRVIQGDINPSGPGYREESVSLNLGGPFDGRYQPINSGSYAVINDAPAFNTQTSLGLQALIWPTLPDRGSQIILSREDPESGAGFRLYLDSEGAVAFEITKKKGKSEGISTGKPLISERWYLISGSYDVENGTLTVVQKLLKPYPKVNVACKVSRNVSANMICADIEAPIMIAARSATNQPAIEHFNGRIEASENFFTFLKNGRNGKSCGHRMRRSCCRLGLLRRDIN